METTLANPFTNLSGVATTVLWNLPEKQRLFILEPLMVSRLTPLQPAITRHSEFRRNHK